LFLWRNDRDDRKQRAAKGGESERSSRNSSGTLAMLAAMRRASSRVFSLVADLEIEHQRRTANDQQGPVIELVA
jgi:hypothetical protein